MAKIGEIFYGSYEFEFYDSNPHLVLRLQSAETELHARAVWEDFKSSDTFQQSAFYLDFKDITEPKRAYGLNNDEHITKITSGGVFARGGDDTIDAFALFGTGQIHVYAEGGDDTINMGMQANIGQASHGHHVYGGSGNDTFNFTDLDKVYDTIVGRIDDFDYSRDKIQIEGIDLDLFNLPENVRLISYNGEHNDEGSVDQTWLHIATNVGGNIFYTLDGARVDMTGDGGANNGDNEIHFLNTATINSLDFDNMVETEFVDHINYVPFGYSADGGITINDYDNKASDVLKTIFGSNEGDLIAAGLNSDVVNARGGHDVVWGGSGKDELHGKHGDDKLFGGSEDDFLLGGKGNDQLIGGDGNDFLRDDSGQDHFDGGDGIDTVSYLGMYKEGGLFVDLQSGANNSSQDTYQSIENIVGSNSTGDEIWGNDSKNTIWGSAGDDSLYGRAGNDKLNGGIGNDRLDGGLGNDVLIGGAGADEFRFDHESGNDTVNDFEEGIDLLIIFGQEFDYLTQTEAENGLIIEHGAGNSILLSGYSEGILGLDDFVFI